MLFQSHLTDLVPGAAFTQMLPDIGPRHSKGFHFGNERGLFSFFGQILLNAPQRPPIVQTLIHPVCRYTVLLGKQPNSSTTLCEARIMAIITSTRVWPASFDCTDAGTGAIAVFSSAVEADAHGGILGIIILVITFHNV